MRWVDARGLVASQSSSIAGSQSQTVTFCSFRSTGRNRCGSLGIAADQRGRRFVHLDIHIALKPASRRTHASDTATHDVNI